MSFINNRNGSKLVFALERESSRQQLIGLSCLSKRLWARRRQQSRFNLFGFVFSIDRKMRISIILTFEDVRMIDLDKTWLFCLDLFFCVLKSLLLLLQQTKGPKLL